ncbi:FHA domain-containing protein [Tautonia sociabilis]|uniref:FHA domain-containing protein n=1 Tax=Tautonia sociabilis TaxID=2080755 RepID=A0A432MGA2_9BACT|nr:FHA domain-containing protein [Tautonia sociabilis]RUL85593.1 FHA domain-containing protein [Tautonia sociabilis]
MAHQGLERFWQASGASAPFRLLIWERGCREPTERLLRRPFAIVGRASPADLVLDHPQVSRRHALLQLIGGRPFCLDLGSRSAISWGGVPRRSGWIEPGRPVEIGPFRIGLDDPGGSLAPLSDPLGDPTATSSLVWLEDQGEPGSGRHRLPIDRTLTTVGRGPDCRLNLGDLSVSRLHCALLRLGETCWIVDLCGRGGIEVNGSRRPWAPIRHGDQLQVGRFRFAVRIEPARPPGLHAPSRPLPLALPGPIPQQTNALSSLPPLPEPVAIELDLPETDLATRAMIAPLIDQFALMQQQLFDQYHHSMMEMMSVFVRLHRDQQGLVDRELRKIRRLTREVRSLREELGRHRVEGDPPEFSEAEPRPNPAPDPIDPRLRPTARGAPEEYRAAQARIIARLNELQRERQGRWQRLLGRLAGGGGGGGGSP